MQTKNCCLQDASIHCDYSYVRECSIVDTISLIIRSGRRGALKKLTITHRRTLDDLWNVLPELVDLDELNLMLNPTIHFASLQGGPLQRLASLKALDLRGDNLTRLPDDVFVGLSSLSLLDLGYNNISRLPSGLFGTNVNLSSVRLQYNGNLKYLPAGLFANCTRLKLLDVSFCSLLELPEGLFQSSRGLEVIRVNNNRLSTLRSDTFRGLSKLTNLCLRGNGLSAVRGDVFSDLASLSYLDLSDNKLASFEDQAFARNAQLKTLNVSKNLLKSEEARKLRPLFPRLTRLDLSHNRLESFADCFQGMPKMQTLNLNGNGFTSIELTDEFLSGIGVTNILLENNLIEFIKLPPYLPSSVQLTLFIDDGTLACDCRNYLMLKRMDDRNTLMIKARNQRNLRCRSLDGQQSFYDLEEINVSQVAPCPRTCRCFYTCSSKEYVVECSGLNLPTYPNLSGIFEREFQAIAVHLADNRLTEGPPRHQGYANISALDLAKNSITHLDWIPSNLESLNLSGNSISTLANAVIEQIKETEVSLHDNPWSCDCDSADFIRFVNGNNIQDNDQITCASNGKLVKLLDRKEVCWKRANMIYALITSCVIVLMVLLTLLGVYCKRIKDRLALGFDADEEKTYDAFISYSHADEDFVVNDLVQGLEKLFKLCIHIRDWVPGELISEQAKLSVLSSRRTIVVLSPNFLLSDWGQVEFRIANDQAVKDGRTRVIVVLYKDVNFDSIGNEELKDYLSRNTYIKWGDLWFWKRLHHALQN